MALQTSIPFNEAEKFILKVLFDLNLEQTYFDNVETSTLSESGKHEGLSELEIEEGLQCLVDRGLVQGPVYFGSSLPSYVQFTKGGFQDACEMEVPDYDKKQEIVARHLAQLTNEDDDAETASVKAIAEELKMPFLVALHFIRFFAALGWVNLQREGGDMAFISYVSPLLDRALEEG